jgi:hypothetical protein
VKDNGIACGRAQKRRDPWDETAEEESCELGRRDCPHCGRKDEMVIRIPATNFVGFCCCGREAT